MTMKNKRTELIVSAISNGTVIDHIQAGNTFRVFRILGLENTDHQVYFGTNLTSSKYGKKGLIKISDKFFEKEDINKIALVAPTATLIEIRDYEVVKKELVSTPETVENIVKCFNPKCVTNNQKVSTKFRVISDHKGNMKLSCHYCEKTMDKGNIEFL
jgi:aspartate carbamoyltransferase regulatory subunit